MIFFENSEKTFEANSAILQTETIFGRNYSVAVTVFPTESLDEVKEAFTNGGTWSIRTEEAEDSYADYAILCKMVDRCDGSVMVYMRRKTENEILEEENAALFFQLMTGEEFV